MATREIDTFNSDTGMWNITTTNGSTSLSGGQRNFDKSADGWNQTGMIRATTSIKPQKGDTVYVQYQFTEATTTNSYVLTGLHSGSNTPDLSGLESTEQLGMYVYSDSGHDLVHGTKGGTTGTNFNPSDIVSNGDKIWMKILFDNSTGFADGYVKGGPFGSYTHIFNSTFDWSGVANNVSFFVEPYSTDSGVAIRHYEWFDSGGRGATQVVDAGNDASITLLNTYTFSGSSVTGGTTDYTYSWTCDDVNVVFDDAAILHPTAYFYKGGVYTFTLSVDDGISVVTNDVVITVVAPAALQFFHQCNNLKYLTKTETHGTVAITGTTNKRLLFNSDGSSPGAGLYTTQSFTLANKQVIEWQFEVDNATGMQVFMGISDGNSLDLQTTTPRSVIVYLDPDNSLSSRGIDTANTVVFGANPQNIVSGTHYGRIIVGASTFTVQVRHHSTSTWTNLGALTGTDFTDWYGSTFYFGVQHRLGAHNLYVDNVWIATNTTPAVNAGSDDTSSGVNYHLNGSISAGQDHIPLIVGNNDDSASDTTAFVTGADLTVTWSKVSGPGTVSFDDSHLLAATATFNPGGTYVLQLVATDGILTSSADSVTIDFNNSPVVSAGTDQVIIWPTASTTLAGSVTDDGLPDPPAAVTALWTVVSKPMGSTVTFVDNTDPTTGVSVDLPGTYVLRLTGDDSQATAHDDVSLFFNRTPSMSAGPNQVLYNVLTTTLEGSASDDGLLVPLIILWTKVSGPGTVNFDDDSDLTSGVTVNAPGDYVLQLSVDDGAVALTDTVKLRFIPFTYAEYISRTNNSKLRFLKEGSL